MKVLSRIISKLTRTQDRYPGVANPAFVAQVRQTVKAARDRGDLFTPGTLPAKLRPQSKDPISLESCIKYI